MSLIAQKSQRSSDFQEDTQKFRFSVQQELFPSKYFLDLSRPVLGGNNSPHIWKTNANANGSQIIEISRRRALLQTYFGIRHVDVKTCVFWKAWHFHTAPAVRRSSIASNIGSTIFALLRKVTTRGYAQETWYGYKNYVHFKYFCRKWRVHSQSWNDQ